MAGAVFEDVKVSQELKHSINKVTFNNESQVNEQMNFGILKMDIHPKKWKPAFSFYRILMTTQKRMIIEIDNIQQSRRKKNILNSG